MSHKKYFSYIRVSTQRQGQVGTSLAEQQAAIERFAITWGLSIEKRFEERETASKQGRPVFLDMLQQLRKGKAQGVIIHKIDRSARNLKDWADLGSLIDAGLEVHFASESLDLTSRGGRLSADIQAVVASDYIRNLREETKKGIHGRLKQGLYPFRAVLGYLDMGKGRTKEIDPVAGPLVRKAFELYATGNWGLIALEEKMYSLGLRNKKGRRVSINGLSTLLNNPFYMGVIRIKKTNELFPGIHETIVSKSLFDSVKSVLDGKNIHKQLRHVYIFRRAIRCINCGYNLIPEWQKGFIYYRCHTKKCLAHCLKEEVVSEAYVKTLEKIRLTNDEFLLLKKFIKTSLGKMENKTETLRAQLVLQQSALKDRISKLIDAYMDGVVDKESFKEKKNQLVFDDHEIKERLLTLDAQRELGMSAIDEFLELANSAYLSYKCGTPEMQRDLVKIVTSNITTDGKSVSIELKKPFQLMSGGPDLPVGSPYREAARTVPAFVSQLLGCFNVKGLPSELAGLEPVNLVSVREVFSKETPSASTKRFKSKVHYNKLWKNMLKGDLGPDLIP